MQPARAEVVQNLTFPASTATTGDFLGARMSLPSWRPCGRGSPKSFVYRYGPTTGKMIGFGHAAGTRRRQDGPATGRRRIDGKGHGASRPR